MNITMIGAGAVGGYFGARMLEAGLDVTFLVRARRAAQLKETGLNVRSTYGDVNFADLKLATAAEEIDRCDVAILAVKNYHLNEETLREMRVLAEKGTYILPLLNGVEHYDTLTKACGKPAVLGGLCQLMTTLDDKGGIVQGGAGHDLTFGPFEPSQQEVCERLNEALQGANMRATLKPAIWSDIWLKYAFITAFSAVTTASRLSIDRIMLCEPAKTVFAQALQEMESLADSCGTPLPQGWTAKTIERMSRHAEGSTSSMHKDFMKGLPLEVESLQGGALRLAASKGLSLPVIGTMYGLLKPFENGNPAG